MVRCSGEMPVFTFCFKVEQQTSASCPFHPCCWHWALGAGQGAGRCLLALGNYVCQLWPCPANLHPCFIFLHTLGRVEPSPVWFVGFFKNNLFMSTSWLPSCWFSNNNNNICYSVAAKYWLFLRAVPTCFIFHFICNNRMDEGVQCHKSSLPQQDNIQALANMNTDDRFEGFLFYSGFQSH